MLDQLVFGFGVPLGVLRVFHSLVRKQLQLREASTAGPARGHCSRAVHLFVSLPPSAVAEVPGQVGVQTAAGGCVGVAETTGAHSAGIN